jgi:branched-chain amino acid transport system permease protein
MSQSINLFGTSYALNRLIALFLALGTGITFYLFLIYTRMGKAIRAAAQDRDTAQLMGVNIHKVLGLCFGLGAFMAAVAGSLISMMFEITPTIGMPYTIIAIIAVVLGGLGNILGSLIGGLILGLVGNIVMCFSPALSLVAYYLIFILLILLKPSGIMGK